MDRPMDGWIYTYIYGLTERDTYIRTYVDPQATEEAGRTGDALKQPFCSSREKHSGILDSSPCVIP